MKKIAALLLLVISTQAFAEGVYLPNLKAYATGTSSGGKSTMDVNVIGSPALPAGASTSAKQDTGNASLSSIDGKITAVNTGAVVVSSSALPSGAATSAKQDTGNTSLSSIDGKITAVNTGAVVVSSSALPSGASTSGNQTTANTSLSSIDGKLPSTLGQKTSAGSLAIVLASDQGAVPTSAPISTTGSGSAAAATVSTVVTLTAPANTVGFVLMNIDTSTTSMRWAIGRTATSTLGQQLQPGRDTGFVPCGANVSIVAESGTVTYDIQWVSR